MEKIKQKYTSNIKNSNCSEINNYIEQWNIRYECNDINLVDHNARWILDCMYWEIMFVYVSGIKLFNVNTVNITKWPPFDHESDALKWTRTHHLMVEFKKYPQINRRGYLLLPSPFAAYLSASGAPCVGKVRQSGGDILRTALVFFLRNSHGRIFTHFREARL